MSSSSSTNRNNKAPVSCLFDSETTILQKQAEKECQPYFVDLSKLPADQKGHLERIGLLKQRFDGESDGSHETTNRESNGNDLVQLLREKHKKYLEGVWKRPLKAPFVSLDSSRPWMLYWCLHGYDLLTSSPPGRTTNGNKKNNNDWISNAEGANMVSTLEDCWQGYHTAHSELPRIVGIDDDLYFSLHEDDENREGSEGSNEEVRYYCGGFGGGPGQMSHAATSYAAILALCILATSGPEGNSGDNNSDGKAMEVDGECNGGDSDDNDGESDDSDENSYRSLHYSERARRVLSEIRIPLYRWMVSLQVPETGGYRMQHDGEVDVRATYTIACCSKLLGLLERKPPKATNATGSNDKRFTVLGRPLVIDFVKSCQTYEGGMGGVPFAEAHGGYTLCAVAALKLLGALRDGTVDANHPHGFDVASLLGWLGRRQLPYEGGFSGRSNKLVDGCYSFWQGGATAIASSCSDCLAGDGEENEANHNNDDPWLARHHRRQKQNDAAANNPAGGASAILAENSSENCLPFPLLYDVFLLERYILMCAQEITGGLRDKPSKPRDFYHTCYNLSGLSIAQNCSSSQRSGSDNGNDDVDDYLETIGFGDPEQTLVGETHPCYNIRIDRVATILDIDWGNE